VQSKTIKLCQIISLIFLSFGMATTSVQAEIFDNDYQMQTQIQQLRKNRTIIFAGDPAICKANYDQCIKGCDGAVSCSNQCMTNYNGCPH
jgi:hypothetical protein